MTNKIKKALIRLWRDESGQGATEYILILVVVSTIVIVFKDKIRTSIEGFTSKTTGQINERIGELNSKAGP